MQAAFLTALAVCAALYGSRVLSATFGEVEPNVFRFNLWWHPLPGVIAPGTVWLIRERPSGASGGSKTRWVLIDTGFPNRWTQAYHTGLMGAVRHMVPQGALQAILLTHTHSDHVGGLHGLLAAYPEASVVVHEADAPFITGKRSWLEEPPAYLGWVQALGLAPPQTIKPLPADHLHVLRTIDAPSDGTASAVGLREAGVNSLSWIPTPGHSPGHVSYLHEPSGVVLAGDAVMLFEPRITFGRTEDSGAGSPPKKGLAYERPLTSAIVTLVAAGDSTSFSSMPSDVASAGGRLLLRLPFASLYLAPSLLCPRPTCDHKEYQRSVCRLARMPFRRLYPTHDATGKGFSREEVQALAAALPACATAAAAA